jgi:hypothetical protein
MKPQALQELVRKIFTDEEIRAQFISNPDSVLSKFSLTEDERRAVLSTHARLGLMTSDSAQLDTPIGPDAWWT